MPELPEVHALAEDLGRRLRGRTIDRLDIVAFPALKTFDPAVSALNGLTVGEVTRHGKFLDLGVGELHLVMHLARAGWVRWREGPPASSGRPGKGPLAARLVLDDGSGLDITEAGTKKSLAIHVVRDPADVPGIARLGPDPLELSLDEFARILTAAGRSQIKGVLRSQSIIAGIGNAYSDEILHAARMSPFKPAAMTADESARLSRQCNRPFARPSNAQTDSRHPNSRRRRSRECACTVEPANRVRCAATPFDRSSSTTPPCSTAPPARPAANRSPTGCCRGC